MSMQYNVHQAKTQFSKLLDEVEKGEEVIIVRNHRPVARIERIAVPQGRILGQHRGEIRVPDESVFAPMTDEEVADFFGDPA